MIGSFDFFFLFYQRHPNGILLASCSKDRSIRIWELNQKNNECYLKVKINSIWLIFFFKEILTEGHEKTIRSIRWSPNGKYLASASFDSTICIWALTDN